MKEDIHNLESFMLVGIAARTTNAAEMAGGAEIPKLWQRFFDTQVIRRIPHALRPGEITVAYTDFESDDRGAYTIVIGTAVAPGSPLPEGMTARTIPGGRYLRIPTARGKLQEIGVAAWVKIWADEPLRQKRLFAADLEIYGADAANPDDASFEIFLGLK